MKSSLNTGIRQSQKIIITQSLRQSIEMLQLSTVELAELINQEFLENPLLEETDSVSGTDTLEDDLNRKLSGDDDGYSSLMEEEIYTSPDTVKSADGSEDDRKRSFIENAVSTSVSLKDHLLWQARMTAGDEAEYYRFEEVITLLDENGFLPANWRDYLKPGEIENIVTTIQSFDPVGCATDSIKESLLVQAINFYPDDKILHDMIENYFRDIEKLDYANIAKVTGWNISVIVEKSRLLQNLNPYPGSSFASKEIKYIIPDIEVKLVEEEIVITLNDDWLPGIRISPYYRNLITRKEAGKEQNDYLTAKLQSAKSFLKNISTRRETIFKVAVAIMERQREFLEMGPGHLKYLTHHDIAEETGVHESTVSRVSAGKYVQTSWGVFELKYFFVSKIKTAQKNEEGNNSSDRVRGLLLEIIASENPENPFNDEELVVILKERGVAVARRTIVKYRDMLNIPSSNMRKKINMIKS